MYLCFFFLDMKPYFQVILFCSQPKVDKDLTWTFHLQIKQDNICTYTITEQTIFLTEILQQRERLVLCSACADLGRGETSPIQQWVKGAKRRTGNCTGNRVWPLLFRCKENTLSWGCWKQKVPCAAASEAVKGKNYMLKSGLSSPQHSLLHSNNWESFIRKNFSVCFVQYLSLPGGKLK